MKHQIKVITTAIYIIISITIAQGCHTSPPPGYVTIEDGHFSIDGEPWFPLMINYKAKIAQVGDSLEVVPIDYYNGDCIAEHFDTIAQWGFNSVRICLDVIEKRPDNQSMYRATERMIKKAEKSGLRVMLLIKPPFDSYWRTYTKGLLAHLSDQPALWAYDFFNEPLYFDSEKERSKNEVITIVTEWKSMAKEQAPHQLFTIATAEPIETFEWDPSMLPVDFIEMHTYHPLRVKSEMWWYSKYSGKPWMIGETGLPADGDSIPYEWQSLFLKETFAYAKSLGAIGYGWWEFQDCPNGVNFEAQWTGMRDQQGNRKPCVKEIKKLYSIKTHSTPEPPVNYYNMLAYENLSVTGTVVDSSGHPIEGAVIRGWNNNWSIGINTYSKPNGTFQLISNDICTHFWISSTRHSKTAIDTTPIYETSEPLNNTDREYQIIDYTKFMPTSGILPTDATHFNPKNIPTFSIGIITLTEIPTNHKQLQRISYKKMKGKQTHPTITSCLQNKYPPKIIQCATSAT